MSQKLSGAEKSRLRGRGQTMEVSLKIGREGASPTVITALQTLLKTHDLVKIRYTAAERDERAIMTSQLAEGTDSACVGSVGSTALFYRPKAVPA